jgi:nitrite reductase (NO-forming)
MNHNQPRIIVFALSLTLLSLATACGAAATGATGAKGGAHVTSGGSISASASAADAQQITVTVGNSMSFAPASLTVKVGQPVELTLVNDGSLAHDFTLTGGVSGPFKLDSPAGQTTRGTFTVERAGTYSFVCSVPGHAPLGMRGRLVVQ